MDMTEDTQTALQPVQVGDLFRCSWGYDQTNTDFYEVLSVSVSGKTVKVRQVCTAVVSESGSAVHVAPIPGTIYQHHPEILTKRLRNTGYSDPTWAFNVASYADAYLWDCKPAYETAQGWGH